MHPATAIFDLWLAWGISWALAAVWSERAVKRPSFGAELGYRVVMGAGAAALFYPAHGYYGPLRFWVVPHVVAWVTVAFVGVGIAFAWWARIHLGKLWSGNITKKEGHRIVESGPYGIVRHPIYTGLLFSIFATAIAKGTLWGILGTIALVVGIWMKARLEERWLRAELGAAGYDDYASRVPMLVPFVRRRPLT